MKKITLVEDWKKAWKWLSMQGMAVALTVQGVWITLPDDWRASLDNKVVAGITMVCLVIGVVGRFVKQDIK
jgi:hypothetical protein